MKEWLSTTMKEKHVGEVHAKGYLRNVPSLWALHGAMQVQF